MKTNYRVLLLYPTLHNFFYGKNWKFSEYPAAPLGPLYIATPLIKEGYQVSFVDLGVDHFGEEQYFDIYRNIDFILITCLTNAYDNIQNIIHDIRSVNKQVNIICGGPHCNETEMHIQGSDLTVYGEGERVITEILERFLSGKSFKDIPGISYMKEGQLVRHPGKHLIENLDSIDPPALQLAEKKKYGYIYGTNLGKVMPLITSRGCPYHCKFCTFQTVEYRERSVMFVIREIISYQKQNARFLAINDDNFMLKKKRIENIANAIISHNIKLRIIIQSRVDSFDYELLKKLKKAGVILIMFGTESANQDILDYYNKKTSLEKIEKIIRMANQLGIITFSGYIIGAPIEQKSHIENNHKFLCKVPQDFLSVNILRFAYPSPLWMEAYQAGKIKKEEIIVSANEKLTNFTYQEWEKMRSNLLKSFYSNPRRIIRIIHKLRRNFGIVIMLRFVISILHKSLYRTPEEMHGIQIERMRISFP